MHLFISSFKSIIVAAAAILCIETSIYVVVRPTFVQRSNYLAWTYGTQEPFYKLLVYRKLLDINKFATDIIQVGDSSGFFGVNPSIVEKYLNGLRYYNSSCCANTGFQGYYDIAAYALERNPNIKVVVLYVGLRELPRTDDFVENKGAPDEIFRAIGSIWAQFSPPSQALRGEIADVVYTANGTIYPASHGPSANSMIHQSLQSVHADNGWMHEMDPRTTGTILANYWKSVCRADDMGDVDFTSTANRRLFYRKTIYGAERFEPFIVFDRFAKLTERYGAKLIIMFQPYPCKHLRSESLSILQSALQSLRTLHPNLTVLPGHIVDHWPSSYFVSAEHLRIGHDVENSRRVGRLLSAALGNTPSSIKDIDVSDATNSPPPEPGISPLTEPGPSILPSMQITDDWYKRGVNIRATDDTRVVFVQEDTSAMHHFETLVKNVVPGQPYIFSIEVKPLGNRMARVAMRDAKVPGQYGSMDCNPAREAASRVGGTYDAGIDALPDGWYRCWASLVYSDTRAAIGIDILNELSANLYQGDGKSGLLVRAVSLRPGWQLPASRVTAKPAAN